MTTSDAFGVVKEVVRLVSTAGLGKDVIDLLDKKVSLLAEQVGSLEAENSDLRTENAELKQKIQALQPKTGVDAEAAQVLLYLSRGGGELTCYQISAESGIDVERVKRHFGYLRNLGFAEWAKAQKDKYDPPNRITDDGNDFLYKQKMI